MIKSKIDPATVQNLKWTEYVKLFQKDIKLAESKGIDKAPIVAISDFKFACGEVHTLLLLGKESVLNKYYKGLKQDSERKKLKDFSMGLCHFEKEEDGSTAIKIGISGFGKPSKIKKNSKKLLQKTGVTLKDIIKGEFLDEVVNDIGDLQNEQLEEQAQTLKNTSEEENDSQKLQKVAKAFSKANKEMNKEVVTLLKLSKSETVLYTSKHVNIAKEAFLAANSLVNKYEEVLANKPNLPQKAAKITALKDNIINNDLVRKYEQIWKKVNLEYKKQMDKFSEPIKAKFAQLDDIFAQLRQAGTNS